MSLSWMETPTQFDLTQDVKKAMSWCCSAVFSLNIAQLTTLSDLNQHLRLHEYFDCDLYIGEVFYSQKACRYRMENCVIIRSTLLKKGGEHLSKTFPAAMRVV